MSELNNLPDITVGASVTSAYDSIISFVSNKVPGSRNSEL